MLDCEYVCDLDLGHSGGHDWRGVPALPAAGPSASFCRKPFEPGADGRYCGRRVGGPTGPICGYTREAHALASDFLAYYVSPTFECSAGASCYALDESSVSLYDQGAAELNVRVHNPPVIPGNICITHGTRDCERCRARWIDLVRPVAGK